MTDEHFRTGHPVNIQELAAIVHAHGPLPDRLDPRAWTDTDEAWWIAVHDWMVTP